jgi:ABC-type transporter MlaC component
MSSNLRSGTLGFAVGVAVTAVAVHAAQPAQHEHPVAPSTQSAPTETMDQMHKMKADPAKHQQMMERMAQCRDMMSMMVEHMKHEGMKKDEPAPHP